LYPIHGGRVLDAAERYGGAPNEYLDFSTNINPIGPPEAVVRFLHEQAADTHALMRYPDPRYHMLREAITQHTKAPEETIVLSGGGTALFLAIVHALRPTSCLLPVPAFSEYHHLLNATRTKTIRFPLRATNNFNIDLAELQTALRQHRPSLCVLTNPHNPSGALTNIDDILTIVTLARKLNIMLAVDEAFIDYIPEHSLTRIAPEHEHLIVLRSLTKFYAIPAMRVGYAVTASATAQKINAHIPSWPITTLASDAAVAALSDAVYETRTRVTNATERVRFTHVLKKQNVHVFPAHANFLLVKIHGNATTLSERLAQEHRILIRDCSSYEGLQENHIRIAVRLPNENDRLAALLGK
jgi:threonine-phosphate decarboxylase